MHMNNVAVGTFECTFPRVDLVLLVLGQHKQNPTKHYIEYISIIYIYIHYIYSCETYRSVQVCGKKTLIVIVNNLY